MTQVAVAWQEPPAADRCTAEVAVVTGDLLAWHRRGITVRMVEPGPDGGVRLGVCGRFPAGEAQRLLAGHYAFPVACYPWT